MGELTFLVGGARSGKSSYALRLARASGAAVTFVATAEARDAEMADRIARHQAERPAGWGLIEEPIDLAGALARVPADTFAIIDCLSLWISNLLELGLADDEIDERARGLALVTRARDGATVVVGNEVGMGIVPLGELTRRYRDALGRANLRLADDADRALLVVAGRGLTLDRLEPRSEPTSAGGVVPGGPPLAHHSPDPHATRRNGLP